MRRKGVFLILCTLLVSCGGNTSSSISFSGNESNSSSSFSSSISSSNSSDLTTSSFTATTLEEVITNSKDNYSSIENRVTIDNLENTTQYYREDLNVDLNCFKYSQNYVSCTTDSLEKFKEYSNDNNNWYYSCYFKDDDGNIKQRYKNTANNQVWTQSLYNQDTAFSKLMLSKIDASLFKKINDSLYCIDTSYLSSEELAKFTSFYGSYTYFEQDYNYFDITVENGVISNISFQLSITSRPETSFEHDSLVTVSIDYFDVGTTNVEIPSLPVYPEDLLEADQDLVQAIENTSDNYTYDETYKIIDENGNEITREFSEKIADDSTYTHSYISGSGVYMDSYDYFVSKVNFNGSITKRLNEVTIIYYNDHVDYSSYDVGVVDESNNRVANLGGAYGAKIFEKNEDGSYSPRDGMPERNNSNNKTYLYITCTNFIQNVVGNYEAQDGSIYHYDMIDFKIYVANNRIEKVNYEFNFTLTDANGVSNLYHYIGNGEFKDIGTTSIVIPTDPNEEKELDSNLTNFYDSIDVTNYSYEESFEVFDNNGDHVDFYTSDKKTIEMGLYQEYVDDPFVQLNLYGTYKDKDDSSKYDFGLINDYYYYGKFNTYNYYKFAEEGDGRYNAYNYDGSYSYTSHAKNLKEYLKYFDFIRETSKGVKLFSLKGEYLSHFGPSLIGSVSINSSLEFQDSMTLSLYTDGSAKISYTYVNYDVDGNKIGTIEGSGTYSNFGTTSVSIPDFNDNFINTQFVDGLNDFSNIESLSKSESIGINNFNNYNNVDILMKNDSVNFYYDEDEEKRPYSYKDGKIVVSYENDNESHEEIIYQSLEADFNKINTEWFNLKGGLYYVQDDYLAQFYNDVFGICGDNFKFNRATIELMSNRITFSLSYQVRFDRGDGKYEVFYINVDVVYSK